MMNMVISEEVYGDLANISDFIAQDSKAKAEKFIDEIFAAIDDIPSHPLAFRKSIYYNDETHRDRIYKKYTIVFEITENSINILSVLKPGTTIRKTDGKNPY